MSRGLKRRGTKYEEFYAADLAKDIRAAAELMTLLVTKRKIEPTWKREGDKVQQQRQQ